MGLGVVDRSGFPHLRAGLLGRISLFTRFIRVSVNVSTPAPSLLACGRRVLALRVELCLPKPLTPRALSASVSQVGLQPGVLATGPVQNIIRRFGRAKRPSTERPI